jgi:hypothetical protein
VEEQISLIELIEPPPVWEATLIEEWLLKLGGKICNSTISATVDLGQQGFDR